MSLFTSKEEKLKRVELQNLILNTNEKKLMVSEEFLDQVTQLYISKRVKAVNKMVDGLFNTKSPRTFFGNYDSISTNLNELIVLEKYHTFKQPTPREFKKMLLEKKDKYALAMINRAWKNANTKANYDPTQGQKREEAKFAPILTEMLEFKDQYTESTLGHIDRFFKSVYGYGIDEIPEREPVEPAGAAPEAAAEPEAAETPEAVEGADGEAAAPVDIGEVQEFTPEDFGDDLKEMKLNG